MPATGVPELTLGSFSMFGLCYGSIVFNKWREGPKGERQAIALACKALELQLTVLSSLPSSGRRSIFKTMQIFLPILSVSVSVMVAVLTEAIPCWLESGICR